MTRSTDLIMAFGNCDSLFKFYLLFLLIVCVLGGYPYHMHASASGDNELWIPGAGVRDY